MTTPDSGVAFPRLAARDLEGTERQVPDAFDGDDNLVLVAFKRHQQSEVDTWVTWGAEAAAAHPGLEVYELPVISTRWSPARGFIDGGMAQAVRAPTARQHTLTIYTDVRRVTDALAIADTSTITALLVDAEGQVRWRASGPADATTQASLAAALEADGATTDHEEEPDVGSRQFDFEFEGRFRPLLAALGVTPSTAHVTLTAETLVARFGPWTCETRLDNVVEVCETGPYRWFKAIGARGSFADRGLSFGSTTAGGVCVQLAVPVPGLLPTSSVRHPGVTVTVADRAGFAAEVRRRAGLG